MQGEHGGSPISWWSYVTSTDFGGAVMENWQSEFLQFSLFIAATIWLVQKGSTESKKLEDAGTESKAKQRDRPRMRPPTRRAGRSSTTGALGSTRTRSCSR